MLQPPFFVHAWSETAVNLSGVISMQDAEWAPVSEAEHCATGVAIGSGLSCTTELAEAGVHVTQGAVRKCAGPCSLT